MTGLPRSDLRRRDEKAQTGPGRHRKRQKFMDRFEANEFIVPERYLQGVDMQHYRAMEVSP